MNSYCEFSAVYDELTQNVDYPKRFEYINHFLIENNITNGTVLDLACGTGSMSIELIKNGFDVIGIDLSENMLEIASNRLLEYGESFSLLKGNMTDFSLDKSVKVCICSLDSINHLNDINDVEKTFCNVYNSLDENGVFIFDVNTIYKHNEILANNTFVFDEEDFYLVWDNEFVNDKVVRILLDMFVWNGKAYDRFSESFEETAYSIDEILEALCRAGFSDISVYDELTLNPPREDSERLYFICKKV
ncbi:class I SAM-dependent DNA methyltransferase [Eubacterium sp.]|uniref:class I SAM-dependent DNA methyltransferase n=1 Tax=Eubacterium sp. TaxID=142586 RepID=UPI003EFFA75E